MGHVPEFLDNVVDQLCEKEIVDNSINAMINSDYNMVPTPVRRHDSLYENRDISKLAYNKTAISINPFSWGITKGIWNLIKGFGKGAFGILPFAYAIGVKIWDGFVGDQEFEHINAVFKEKFPKKMLENLEGLQNLVQSKWEETGESRDVIAGVIFYILHEVMGPIVDEEKSEILKKVQLVNDPKERRRLIYQLRLMDDILFRMYQGTEEFISEDVDKMDINTSGDSYDEFNVADFPEEQPQGV